MTARTVVAGAEGGALATPAASGRRLRLRHLWIVPGLAIAVIADGQAKLHGLGILPVLAFGILPHLPVLIGRGQRRAKGHIARRAVPLFNVLHHAAPPVVIAGLGVIGILPPLGSVIGLAWLSHIVFDRAFDAGLRNPDGSVRRTRKFG